MNGRTMLPQSMNEETMNNYHERETLLTHMPIQALPRGIYRRHVTAPETCLFRSVAQKMDTVLCSSASHLLSYLLLSALARRSMAASIS